MGPQWLAPALVGGSFLFLILWALYKWKTKWSKAGLPPPFIQFFPSVGRGQVTEQDKDLDVCILLHRNLHAVLQVLPWPLLAPLPR